MVPLQVQMPWAVRLRALYALRDNDGATRLVYDLERAAVVEVPEDLQEYIERALDSGDPDEALLGWLRSEDLLTAEGREGWKAAGLDGWSASPELGMYSLLDDELEAQIDASSEAAAEAGLDRAFRQAAGAARLTLRLLWSGAVLARKVLEQVVVLGRRRAAHSHQDVAFEVVVAASSVDFGMARFLAQLPVSVELLCEPFPGAERETPSGWDAEGAAQLLLPHLGDRLTVYCPADRGHLLELWEWAKRLGIRHLDAAWADEPDPVRGEERRRLFQRGLQTVWNEMAADLAGGRLPVDFKPLTRILSRLMHSEPLDLLGSSDASTDCWALIGTPCAGCFARRICSHSLLHWSSFAQADQRQPAEDRCNLWRDEAEAALRFYHRLAHIDPIQVLRLFGEPGPLPGNAAMGRAEDMDHWKAPS
jgi:hypothetical protein